MIVRRSSDVDLVHSLERCIFAEYGDEPLDVPEEADWWIAWDGSEPVGFGGLRIFREEGFAYFLRAGVLRGYRGKGAHRRLTRCRLAFARKSGCAAAITYTMPTNIRSANNMISAGFRLYQPGYAWADDALYWMQNL